MLFGAQASSAGSGGGNFLIPNGTFIVELVIFIVVLGVVAKFILPPIQQAMDQRDATVRAALNASDEGQAEANRLALERRQVLEAARNEARSITELAGAQVSEMFEDARAKGQTEHDRLVDEGRVRIEAERDRVRDESITHLGDLVVQAASQVIGSTIDGSKHRLLIDEVVSSTRSSSGA